MFLAILYISDFMALCGLMYLIYSEEQLLKCMCYKIALYGNCIVVSHFYYRMINIHP
jgi:hypothetical protein